MSNTVSQDQYYDSLIGKEIKSTYRVDHKIGAGGMGAVFKATNLQDGSIVALKIISPQLVANSKFVKRFQREAKVGWILSHPNIVKVHEFGETEDSLLYMAMEFVEGETLKSYLASCSALSPERCLELIKPICDGLEAAHKRNILHRDLKPENILITKDSEGKETLKLADFGLVKLMQPDSEITKGSNLTEVGEVFGTPHYMSPEQVLGQPIEATADIYSLGVILHQMLTGKVPIQRTNIREILLVKVSEDMAPPSSKYSFLSPAFDSVLQRVLARHPEDRYQKVGLFFQAFQQAVTEAESPVIIPSKRTNPQLEQPTELNITQGGNTNEAFNTSATTAILSTQTPSPTLTAAPSTTSTSATPSTTVTYGPKKRWWEFWKK
ncbi:MAG: serine/threonine-protein kinase [Acidobacteriota bacterium]